MLSTVELDYIQHLERGYCENHPDVIAETKDQVVDRAVKQLLTALQSNGFELDGNILKRGNGWIQYDATSSAWQYSNDAGVTWQDMGSGGGGVTDHTLLTNIGTNTHAQIDTFMDALPAEIANPVTIGQFHLRDDSGTLQFSDDGESWNDFQARGWNVDLIDTQFYPPLKVQPTDPTPSIYNVSLTIWENNTDNTFWLLYKNSSGVSKKVQLT